MYTESNVKQIKSYEMLFYIENSLRVLMHNCLIKKIGVDYFDENKILPFNYLINGQMTTINIIKSIKEKKQNDEPLFKIKMGYDYPYLWYTDYLELISALDFYWNNYFSEAFEQPRRTKRTLIEKLSKLKGIRNSIAHNRYISISEHLEIESAYSIVITTTKKEYIYNYDDIVYNQLEKIKEIYTEMSYDILKNLQYGNIIKRDVLRKWKSNFGILADYMDDTKVILFKEVYSLLEKYNNSIPQKPGRIADIREYVKEQKIIEKIKGLL